MKAEIERRNKVLVQFLGAALGPDYEVVLQSIDGPDSGIIAIANPGISGREVGGPLTNIALKLIQTRKYEESDFALNYTGRLDNGKIVRSSTMFIKDEGKLVGMLCINFDDSRIHDVCNQLIRMVHPDHFVQQNYHDTQLPKDKVGPKKDPNILAEERFRKDAQGILDDIYMEESIYLPVPFERLTQEEKIDFIARLESHGIFEIKGAVAFLTKKLNSSQASIYRYISQAKELQK